MLSVRLPNILWNICYWYSILTQSMSFLVQRSWGKFWGFSVTHSFEVVACGTYCKWYVATVDHTPYMVSIMILIIDRCHSVNQSSGGCSAGRSTRGSSQNNSYSPQAPSPLHKRNGTYANTALQWFVLDTVTTNVCEHLCRMKRNGTRNFWTSIGLMSKQARKMLRTPNYSQCIW